MQELLLSIILGLSLAYWRLLVVLERAVRQLKALRRINGDLQDQINDLLWEIPTKSKFRLGVTPQELPTSFKEEPWDQSC